MVTKDYVSVTKSFAIVHDYCVDICSHRFRYNCVKVIATIYMGKLAPYQHKYILFVI
jgi:hypothetical protein